MKTILLLLLSGWLLLPSPARAQTPPAGFTNTVVSSGWNEAVGLAFTATGSQMFVWERPGKVWVVTNGQRQLVLDLTEEVGGWADQGLLGFALDPHFATNGYIYLLYVVDRHHLLNFGTAAYSATTNDYYSATIGRLTRYTAVAAGTGYTVSPASRLVLLGATKTTGIPSTFNGHVTAALAFGADGTLLVATGDGAHPYQDQGNYNLSYAAQAQADGIISAKENIGSLRAQLVDCLSGKVLRLNPATGAGVPSNPFYDAANPSAARSRVWALGVRNPFRMAFRPGTGSPDPAAGNPGALYLGDVGAATWEETDVVDRPGLNLGWPLFEGLTSYSVFATSSVVNRDAPNPLFGTGGCTQQFFNFQDLIKQATPSGTATFANPCNAAQVVPAGIATFVHTRPLLDWNHVAAGPSRTGIFSGGAAATANLGAAGGPVSGAQFGGSASTGGVFYPYPDFPAQYRNTYFFGDYVGGWVRSLTVNAAHQPSAVNELVGSGAVPVAFATSPGETGLFYVNFEPSEIRKISYVTVASPPLAVASSDKTFGPSPLGVQFTGSASADPNGGALTYRWDFGDGTTSALVSPAHTFTAPTPAPTAYHVTLTVTNGQGLTNQAALLVSANNTPPQVTITSPAAGTHYPLSGNTAYQLRATVADAEQSNSHLSYAWQTILHHATHEHPDPVDTTRQTSTTIVPYGCGAETYYYRIVLTVTDAGGLATTKEVRLDPDCTATSLTLVNADDNEDVQTLVNGATLDLATLPTRNLNIRANANPATTASVVFRLSGAATQNQTESTAPYALFSDNNGAYVAWTPPVGAYTLLATPYAGGGGSGAVGAALSINFTVTDSGAAGPFTLTTATVGSGTVARNPSQTTYLGGSTVMLTATPAAGFQFSGWSGSATGLANPLSVLMSGSKSITATFTATVAAQSVTSYTLVSADTNADIQTLVAGVVLNLATLPTRRLSIRANTNPATVGSVVFSLSGAATQNQTETTPPYALFADNGGLYNAWTPPLGSYSLLGTPFTAGGGTGTAGTALSLAFSVIDQVAGPFTLTTATVGSGAVAKNPNQATYASGTTVSLTATPAAGFQFSGWSGDATGSVNPLAVVMTGNKAITATFTALSAQYSLTTTTVGSGAVAASPSQATYASGTVVTLTATPATGFQFSGWSGGATGAANPLAVTLSANTTITATFTATTVASYALTVGQTGSGTVVASPSQAAYLSGSTVTLTATAAAGFQFAGWSGAATGTANPLAVVMTGNKTITAAFTAITGQSISSYTLVSADTNADIQTLVAGVVLNLATLPTRRLSIRANTSPATVGSVVFALTGAATQNQTETTPPYALFADNNNGVYVAWTPLVGSYSLRATPFTGGGASGTAGTAFTLAFSVIDQVAGPFALTTATVGSGTVAANPSQATYLGGSTVMLTATPAAGFQFSGWSGDATGSANPLAVAMTGNKAITATFAALPAQYTLTVTTTGSGTVVRSPNQATYASGTTVSLTATPAAGFQFAGWSGGATGSANPLAITLSANTAITATFAATTTSYALTVSQTGSGTVARSPNQTTYLSGTTVSLAATAAAGFQFAGWSGAATGAANPLSVVMTGNKTIMATFTAVTGQQVSGLFLVNADTDLDLQVLAPGAVLNLATLPTTNLTIRATTSPAVVGSVVFNLSGPQPILHTENSAPYALLADSNGDYFPWTPALGSYSLVVTPYAGASGGGAVGAGISLLFSVINTATKTAARTATATSSLNTATVTATAAAADTPATTYPNPSRDGRYWLRLPAAYQGRVGYRLLSVLGATVATGELVAEPGAAALPLDFSAASMGTGVYFLLLDNQGATAQLRLLRE